MDSYEPDMPSAFLSNLGSKLACPKTRGELRLIPLEIASGDTRSAILWSNQAATVVGVVENYRFRFEHFTVPEELRKAISAGNFPEPRVVNSEKAWDVHELASPRLSFEGAWDRLTPYWLMADPRRGQMNLTFHAKGPVGIQFSAHPSSGIASVFVNRQLATQVDLFHPHTAVPRICQLALERDSLVEVRPSGEKNAKSRAAQVIVESVAFEGDDQVQPRYTRTARSRSNDFRGRAKQMMASVPPDGTILDIGGGRRMVNDARYVNLDYAAYDEVDVTGDAQHLPFKDSSIDFVHSSAVFEHLPDPAQAAREIYRVLKPGGQGYINCAFMQPVHSEGQHFYNATIWGLENWFSMFPHRAVDYSGSFSHLIAWLSRVAGIQRRARPEDWASFDSLAKSFDKLVTKEKLLYIASEIWIEVSK
jgi:ubiquinone/menaquinone biosynthesis C-methylase UbiE